MVFHDSIESVEKIQLLLDETKGNDTPAFWEGDFAEKIFVPVNDGEILVYHIKPKNPVSIRPLVFVPGWGVIPQGFKDLYEVLRDKVEFFYIETREKKSSRLKRFKAKMTMSQKAKDISDALEFLELNKQNDFILMGTCWGSSIILQGLMEKSIDAPTIITYDPMHRLWYPQWVLNIIAPIIPIWIITLLKPFLKWLRLRKMTEKVQKQRAVDFIDNAVIWKWRRAAYQVRNFELFGNMSQIFKEVFVVNGTDDLIHDKRDYPKIAKELPNGRFICFKIHESNRERLMGIIAREFSKSSKEDGIPSIFQNFEVKLD